MNDDNGRKNNRDGNSWKGCWKSCASRSRNENNISGEKWEPRKLG